MQNFREKVKAFLQKTSLLYGSIRSAHRKVNRIRSSLLGTRLEEKRWAKKYPKDFSNLTHPHRRFLVEKIGFFHPESILEVGCSYGPNLFWLAKNFSHAQIKGIDISPKAIKIGNEFLTEENISNVELLVGKADEISRFQDREFDIVFSDAALIYIGPDKIRKVIEEMKRISFKALIFLEWHDKNLNDLGEYDVHIGVWKRNYLDLLKSFFVENQIQVSKIPRELWPDENWQKFGYIIEVRL